MRYDLISFPEEEGDADRVLDLEVSLVLAQPGGVVFVDRFDFFRLEDLAESALFISLDHEGRAISISALAK